MKPEGQGGKAERPAEELVLELREVGEEVQVMNSLQREVEQLDEKLTELGGKAREFPPLDTVGFGSPEEDTTVKKAGKRRSCKYSSYTSVCTDISCHWWH